MRTILLTPILALALPVMAADPPVKRGGGFFGFGAPPAEQISAGLFPEQGESANLSSGATRVERRPALGEGIFRSGEPQRVAPVSYVIEDGRRVERPVTAAPVATTATEVPHPEKPLLAMNPLSSQATEPILAAPAAGSEKKRGFLGFGKKGQEEAEENPIVPPLPAAAPLMAATPVTVPAAPVVTQAPVESPTPLDTATVSDVKTDTPEFAGVKPEKERSSWIPFLGRKKQESSEIPSPAAVPMAAESLAAKPVTSPSTSPSAPVAGETPAGAAAKPSNEVATYEIRRDETQPATEKREMKEEREGGILSPIAKIRPPRKEIDLTGAETIIANGEIVKESTAPATSPAPVSPDSSPGPRQAPQVVNGVKTYSSWDDVNARTASAADRIIGQMR